MDRVPNIFGLLEGALVAITSGSAAFSSFSFINSVSIIRSATISTLG